MGKELDRRLLSDWLERNPVEAMCSPILINSPPATALRTIICNELTNSPNGIAGYECLCIKKGRGQQCLEELRRPFSQDLGQSKL